MDSALDRYSWKAWSVRGGWMLRIPELRRSWFAPTLGEVRAYAELVVGRR